ncbi:hypothetical protein Tco_0689320 [Tanacetum coccineum]
MKMTTTIKVCDLMTLRPIKTNGQDYFEAPFTQQTQLEYSEKDQLDEEKDDKDGDADDEGDEHISDTQDVDDGDAETESDTDEIYKYKILEPQSVEEVGDAEKVVGSNFPVNESTEFPLPSSSLSVSSGFGTQFFNSSFDISVTGALKDTAEVDVSSLMDIHIQQDTPQIQSPSVLKVLVSVILETTNLLPIHVVLTETPVSAAVSSPHVTPTISTVQQTTTLIPTPPIITDAPIITSVVPESDALSIVQLRVAKLEKDVSKLKKIDHSTKALATLKLQVPTVVEQYLGSKICNDLQKEMDIQEKDKIKAKKHENGKSMKRKVKSKPSQKPKVKVNKSQPQQSQHKVNPEKWHWKKH